jgi:hypothetical protein
LFFSPSVNLLWGHDILRLLPKPLPPQWFDTLTGAQIDRRADDCATRWQGATAKPHA